MKNFTFPVETLSSFWTSEYSHELSKNEVFLGLGLLWGKPNCLLAALDCIKYIAEQYLPLFPKLHVHNARYKTAINNYQKKILKLENKVRTRIVENNPWKCFDSEDPNNIFHHHYLEDGDLNGNWVNGAYKKGISIAGWRYESDTDNFWLGSYSDRPISRFWEMFFRLGYSQCGSYWCVFDECRKFASEIYMTDDYLIKEKEIVFNYLQLEAQTCFHRALPSEKNLPELQGAEEWLGMAYIIRDYYHEELKNKPKEFKYLLKREKTKKMHLLAEQERELQEQTNAFYWVVLFKLFILNRESHPATSSCNSYPIRKFIFIGNVATELESFEKQKFDIYKPEELRQIFELTKNR